MTTEQEVIQELAKKECYEAFARLNALVSKCSQLNYVLKYDEVSDIAEFLNTAAWRLKP